MASTFCPRCGELRIGAFQFCRKCGLDLDAQPVDAVVTPPTFAPPPQPPPQWEPEPRNVPPRLLQPVHPVEDLIDLPRLAFGTFAIGLPWLVMIVVFGIFEASGANITNRSLQALAFNLLIFPPPFVLTLLAGLLADRSSYLAGGIVGLLAGIFFAIYVLTTNFMSSNGELVTDAIRMQNVVYGLVVSTVVGVLLGGFGGLLRRLVFTLKV